MQQNKKKLTPYPKRKAGQELEAFKEYLLIKGHSKGTLESMALTVHHFIAWIEEENIPLSSISYADITAYIQVLKKRSIKQKTQSTYIGSIKKYLDHLTEQNILNGNPAAHIKLQGIRQRCLYTILTEEELDNLYNRYPTDHKGQQIRLAARQNKIITGLLIWQGLKTEDLGKLTVSDVRLREGKIHIPGGRKTESRVLDLKPRQIADLMDFVYETRKEILTRLPAEVHRTKERLGTQTLNLFVPVVGCKHIHGIMQGLIRKLKKQQPKLKSVKQIRASVITHWLGGYNLRRVQYMAGHRYVSSTEKFKINDMEGLQEEINKFHPIH